MRYRYLALLMTAACLRAHADDYGKHDGCVEVEVNGRTEQSISCLARKLLPPQDAMAKRPPAATGAEQIAGRPSNQLGLYNRAATEHRMGDTFGRSLSPQRPAAAPVTIPRLPVR